LIRGVDDPEAQAFIEKSCENGYAAGLVQAALWGHSARKGFRNQGGSK
jgi:hypothetical protein